MKRKIIAFVLLVSVLSVVLLMGSGCSSDTGATVSDPDALAETLKNTATLESGDLVPVPAELLDNYYPGLSEFSDDFEILINGTGGKVDEIAVINGKNGVKTSDIKSIVEKRIQGQKDRFVDYVPAEMPKLENAAIHTSGNTVILLISEDKTPDSIISAALK